MIFFKTGDVDQDHLVRVEHAGPITQERDADGKLLIRSQGDLVIELACIKRVTVEDMVTLRAHEITEVFGSTSHYLLFYGGGNVRLAYASDGTLIDLIVDGVMVQMSGSDRLSLRIQDAA